jgi:hypothetical protein
MTAKAEAALGAGDELRSARPGGSGKYAAARGSCVTNRDENDTRTPVFH